MTLTCAKRLSVAYAPLPVLAGLLAALAAHSALAEDLPAPRAAPLVPDIQHCDGRRCPTIGPAPARLFPQVHLYTPEKLPFPDDRRRRPAFYMTDLADAVNAVAEGGTIFVHDGDHRFTTAKTQVTPKSFTLRAQPGDEGYARLRTARRACLVLTPWAEPRRVAPSSPAPADGPAAGATFATVAIENLLLEAGPEGADGEACIRAQNVNVVLRNVRITVRAKDAIAVDLMSGAHTLSGTEIVNAERGASIGVKVGGRSDVAFDESSVRNFKTGLSVAGRVRVREAKFSGNGASIRFDSDLPATPLPASSNKYWSTVDASQFFIGRDAVGVAAGQNFVGGVALRGGRFEAEGGDGGTGVTVSSGGGATFVVGAADGASTGPQFVNLAVGVDAAGPIEVSGAAFVDNATALKLDLIDFGPQSLSRVADSTFDAPSGAKLIVFRKVDAGQFEFGGNSLRSAAERKSRAVKEPFARGVVVREATCQIAEPRSDFDQRFQAWATRKSVCLPQR